MATVEVFFTDGGGVSVTLVVDDATLDVTGVIVTNDADTPCTARLGAFTAGLNARTTSEVNIPRNRRPKVVRDDFGTLTLSGSGGLGF